MKKIVNLLEVKKDLDVGDYGGYLVDFKYGDIDLAFSEIANKNIDDYHYNLVKWLLNDLSNRSYINEAVNTGLISSDDFDIFGALENGQYLQILEELNDKEYDILLNYILNYLINVKGINELDEETYNNICGIIEDCNALDEIIEDIEETLEEATE